MAARGRYNLLRKIADGGTAEVFLAHMAGSAGFKRARVAKVPIPLNLTLHVMGEVCRGLAYAHSREENGTPLAIVHRDVSQQGEVKLTDFGIARARTRATTSQIGTVKGKPAFMPPSRRRGTCSTRAAICFRSVR